MLRRCCDAGLRDGGPAITVAVLLVFGVGDKDMVGALEIVLVFCVTCVATFALRQAAAPLGLVDRPGGHKAHARETPLVGGGAIYLSMLLTCVLVPGMVSCTLPFLAGATLLLLVGTVDDLRRLAPAKRLLAQAAAALIMSLWGDVVVRDLGPLLGEDSLELGQWALPFTLFAAVGVINAINMIDGLDGLAGGLVLVVVGTLVVSLPEGWDPAGRRCSPSLPRRW